ncbi:tryptophan synthase subunit alpha [Spirochaetota bacterium]
MKNEKQIMTHIVLGYPSLKDNEIMIEKMSLAGVKYIELQIPFSDPIADGPTILNANQAALEKGIHVKDCFSIAEKLEKEDIKKEIKKTIKNKGITKKEVILKDDPDKKYHIVGLKESLIDISIKYYGKHNYWWKIYNANKGKIKKPELIYPGQKIIIPDIKK